LTEVKASLGELFAEDISNLIGVRNGEAEGAPARPESARRQAIWQP